MTLQDYLRTRFHKRCGVDTPKERLNEIVRAEFDEHATVALISRAVTKAFGKKTHGSSIKKYVQCCIRTNLNSMLVYILKLYLCGVSVVLRINHH